MSEKKEFGYDPRIKPGRFSWVKKLLQSKNSSLSLRSSSNQHKNLKHKTNSTKSSQELNNIDYPTDGALIIHPPLEQEKRSTNRDNQSGLVPARLHKESLRNQDALSTKTNGSVTKSLKAPSVAQESVFTRPDNTSTLPVISMSTISVRSSTFSENSQQSTSATVTSDHPTLFTNASTVGIPPSSIFDRRERASHQPFSISSFHYSNTNNSIHTFNTAISPSSNQVELNDNN